MGRTLVPLAARLAEAFCREDAALHDCQQAQCSEDNRKRREKAGEQAEQNEKGDGLRALHQSG